MKRRGFLITASGVGMIGALIFMAPSSSGKLPKAVSALPDPLAAFGQKRAVPKSEAEKPSTPLSRARAKREQAEKAKERERAKNARSSQNIQSQKTEPSLVSALPVKVKPKVFHGDLRRIPHVKEKLRGERPEPQEVEPHLPTSTQPDSALQNFLPAAPAPTPSTSFAGLDFANWGAGWPPDTTGDVGPNHYIQAVNTSIGVYDKSTGTRLAAFTFNQFFSQSPTGTPCDNNNQGDPVVLYDALADRWIITDFAWSNYTSGAMYQCMAVSQTGDPVTGGWYFYPWQTAAGGKIPDYPKLGVWPDGIYMSANVFNTTGTQAFQNVQVWAFDRVAMESGAAAGVVSFTLPTTITGVTVFSLLPSNLRNNGNGLPEGTPNYFASIWGLANRTRVWKFHVDYAVPANSTFTGPTNVTISTFGSGPSTAPEQTGNPLDTLTYRLMMQNQYQNVNGTESLWLTHTVGNGGSPNIAQIRWYQLNVTGGTVVAAAPIQQGTWAPDASYRFMPSLALDKTGAMALGYTVSSSTMFPSIRYAGRLANDALNTLGQGETSLIEGTGYQCCNFGDGTPNTRWGDYSTMSVDPADGCTFWYTNEYYDTAPATLGQDNWKTRIGAFKFPSCVANTLGVLEGTVTDAVSTNPISGALVSAGIYSLKTNTSGFYRFSNLPTGSYTVNVSASGYPNGSANNVVVSSGATTTQNFALGSSSVNTSLAVSAATGTYGGTTTLSATLTQQGGGALGGKTITFTLNGLSFANNTATTNGSGVATLNNVSLVGISAGTYPSGVGASFAAGGGFNGSSGSNSLTISKATPVITWNTPAPISQGTALSGSQLNATSPVAGSFNYSPVSGTVLALGDGQALNVTFTPTDSVNYNNNAAQVSIDVLNNPTVWVEDAIPAGAQPVSDGGDNWTWTSSNPTPLSGTLAHQSNIGSGEHQHYFFGATNQLVVNTGDHLIAYVYLDPANLPSEVMLQWNINGDWNHRAYWGANNINWGINGTSSLYFMGALPAAGQWVKLAVPASAVGLEGTTLNGMAFTLFGGRATWDYAGKTSGTGGTPTPTPTPSPAPPGIWIEDTVPAGAVLAADGGDGWNWIGSNPTPFSGNLANQSNVASGVHQHYFYGATATLTVNAGESLIAYIYIDPGNVPSEIMLQWNVNGDWNHRAYWGSNLINWGTDGTNSLRFMGGIPATGQWIKLEVPASLVGLGNTTLNGMAFTLFGGRATWDSAGKSSGSSPTPTPTPTPTPSPAPPGIWVEDAVPVGATLSADGGDSWNWISSNPTPFSGNSASHSNISSGPHQHYFYGATDTLTVNTGDTLIAYVYIDPANPPSEIMLQWHSSGSWDHRAYWGANNISWGTNGTNSLRFMGALPATGVWVRLQVPASSVGLQGKTVNGMAFTLFGGRATWDSAGKAVP